MNPPIKGVSKITAGGPEILGIPFFRLALWSVGMKGVKKNCTASEGGPDYFPITHDKIFPKNVLEIIFFACLCCLASYEFFFR